MGGTARRNFSLFRKLCGEHGLQNVIIVTTRWADVPLETGLKREEQLRSQDNLFRPALENGATLLRHDNTVKGTHDILEKLVNRQAEPVKIQTELVEERKDISETAAGAELCRQLEEQAGMFGREIEDLRREIRSALIARDVRAGRDLREAKEQFELKLQQVVEGRDKLSELYNQEKRASEELRQTIKALTDDQKRIKREHEEERQRHRARVASVQGVHVELSKAHKELAAGYSTQIGNMGSKLEELGKALEREQEQSKQMLQEERQGRERDGRELQEIAEVLKKQLEYERAAREKEKEAMLEKERERETEWQKLRNKIRAMELKIEKDPGKKERAERKTTPLVSSSPPPSSLSPSSSTSKGLFDVIWSYLWS